MKIMTYDPDTGERIFIPLLAQADSASVEFHITAAGHLEAITSEDPPFGPEIRDQMMAFMIEHARTQAEQGRPGMWRVDQSDENRRLAWVPDGRT